MLCLGPVMWGVPDLFWSAVYRVPDLSAVLSVAPDIENIVSHALSADFAALCVVFTLLERCCWRCFALILCCFHILPKKWFYVISPPENVDFTWFYLPKTYVLRDFASRKRRFYVISPPKTFVLRDFASRKRCIHIICLPKTLVLRDFASRKRWIHIIYLPKTFVLRDFASRKRWFYVNWPPDNVDFTWFHPPKTLVLRYLTSRKRWFYIVLPPEKVCFMRFYLPKTLVWHCCDSRKVGITLFHHVKTLFVHDFASRGRWFYVILHPKNAKGRQK